MSQAFAYIAPILAFPRKRGKGLVITHSRRPKWPSKVAIHSGVLCDMVVSALLPL
jgi:hypothetical protein